MSFETHLSRLYATLCPAWLWSVLGLGASDGAQADLVALYDRYLDVLYTSIVRKPHTPLKRLGIMTDESQTDWALGEAAGYHYAHGKSHRQMKLTVRFGGARAVGPVAGGGCGLSGLVLGCARTGPSAPDAPARAPP